MKDELLKVLEHSKNYTIAMAKAMPAQDFKHQILDGHWKFNELINHIAYSIIWWDAESISKKGLAWDPPQPADTKDGMLAYVNEAYSTLKSSLENTEITDDIVRGFNEVIDHTTHHRGQAVFFLRSKGIVPPEYVY